LKISKITSFLNCYNLISLFKNEILAKTKNQTKKKKKTGWYKSVGFCFCGELLLVVVKSGYKTNYKGFNQIFNHPSIF
jgi:hypothetical protein